MSDTIWLALIVIAGSVVTWLLDRMDRREDWRRQDKVAADARDAKTAVEVVRVTLAESTKTTNQKLDHQGKLINSLYSAAKQQELVGYEVGLAALIENVDLRRALNQEPTPTALAAIGAIEAKLKALRSELAERTAAAAVADALKGQANGKLFIPDLFGPTPCVIADRLP